jgi:hypothetical protein
VLDVISDRVPKELIRPRELWRPGKSHVMGAVNNYVIPHYLIPYSHEVKICREYGDNDKHQAGRRSVNGMPGCSCGRTFSWFGKFCLSCGDFFLQDFHDKRFCAFWATCYNCLSELPWEYCLDHGVKDPVFVEHLPTGANPRKFTDEELKDVFDFD